MKKIFVFALLLISAQARANIVCAGISSLGPITVDIADEQITVSGAGLSKPTVYTNLSGSYDGHMTTLITGAGISVSYQNLYGCIHRAKITTNIRDFDGVTSFFESFEVPQCRGGSTPDNICFHTKE